MSVEQAITPPYLAYATFKSTIQNLALSTGKFPRQIDHTVLPTLSGSARKMFLASLRFFDLIDDSGAPKDRLVKLAEAKEDQWKEWMGILLAEKYPKQVHQLANASPKSLRDNFVESFSNIGSSLVEPAIRFLTSAAKDSGLEVSSYLSQRKARVSPSIRRKPRKEARQAVMPDEDASEMTNAPSTYRDALLGKFPSFDPSWKPEQQQAWFDAYKRLLEMHDEKENAK